MDPKHDKADSKKNLSKWLDRLQQESWQLELLISGFAIFLLIGGYGYLVELDGAIVRKALDSSRWQPIMIAYHVVCTACLALIVGLIVHVLLRGIWIAALGLRYISGDIDYDRLRYRPRYISFLRRRIGGFDNYIEQLERLCSVAFSVALLIIFSFLSFVTFTLLSVTVQVLYGWVQGRNYQWENGLFGGGGFIPMLFLLLGLIFFIDFITLGFFKRNRWTGTVFYPIYRVVGWITLSRLYRPLYHNLVDNRFGRRLAYLLPVFLLLALVGVSITYAGGAHTPYYVRDGLLAIDADNYDDTAGEEWDALRRPSLPSKFAANGYVELFVPYMPRYHDAVLEVLDPGLPPSQYPGIKLRGAFNVGEIANDSADYRRTLAAMQRLHRVVVDRRDTLSLQPRFYRHTERKQDGLLYMIPVRDLPPGEHTVLVESRFSASDTTVWNGYGNIYFYK